MDRVCAEALAFSLTGFFSSKDDRMEQFRNIMAPIVMLERKYIDGTEYSTDGSFTVDVKLKEKIYECWRLQ